MSELAIWTPKPLSAGTDLLPAGADALQQIDMRGRENIEQRDIRMPTLKVMSGQSKAMREGREGAKLGKIHMSGAEVFFDAPFRVLLAYHFRSRALFPDERDPRSRELEVCISRNGHVGNVYGLCEECKYKDWGKGKNADPPVCSESHNFVTMTKYGPAVLRLGRKSYPAARDFITEWQLSPHPLWHHPVVVTAKQGTKQLKSGGESVYFMLAPRWDRSETVPPAAQEQAWQLYQQVKAAHEQDKFGTDTDDEPEGTDQ